jgi:epoxyqueuosine reductase
MKISSHELKEQLLKAGFSAAGIAPAVELSEDREKLEDWLRRGYQGQMAYLAKDTAKRSNPSLLLPGAKTVISVLKAYNPHPSLNTAPYRIARYAMNNDYHHIIKIKLSNIIDWLNVHFPGSQSIACVDSAAVFDKRNAQRAGLGWIGKNTLLINRQHGSFFNIGEIITTIDFETDEAEIDHCGNCRRCIDACPNAALTAEGSLIAPRCIAYLTIEYKGEFSQDDPPNLQNYIFGCDLCQEACPYNANALKTASKDQEQKHINPETMTQEAFRELFINTTLYRTGYQRILRNITQVQKSLHQS